MASMSCPRTLEEKIGQLLMVHFPGREANEAARRLIAEAHVGNFILYEWANELSSPQQVRHLTDTLQQMAQACGVSYPLLIAVDQEGGKVQRLRKGFSSQPDPCDLKTPEAARSSSSEMSRELAAVGIQMALAPVVDCSSESSLFDTRCFGKDSQTVIQQAGSSIDGWKEHGTLCVLKHFPGHGAVSADSHEELPVVNVPEEELWSTHVAPFRELAGRADAIMTAHIQVPYWDSEWCVTLSRSILRGILRERILYEGVIMSDSLVMQGVLEQGGDICQTAIRALQAGCDILCLGGKVLNTQGAERELSVEDVLQVHRALVQAVRNGELSEEEIDRSVERVTQGNCKNPY